MEGAWVGTWRPHPRRGPILAEFSTPGPKYGLPGTTGHPGHDPTRDRAPAYTFRGTKITATDSCSPGPRYYIHSSITNTGKYVSPSAHVTGRYKTKNEVTPGPSDYTTEPANKHVYLSAPANSMVSRPKDLKGFQTPGMELGDTDTLTACVSSRERLQLLQQAEQKAWAAGHCVSSTRFLLSQNTNFSHFPEEPAAPVSNSQCTPHATEARGTGMRPRIPFLLLTASSAG
uniref:Outer dense fiber of sperm tails 3 n=1 Tax=Ficedula albicollis TaxID=59894 RepID=A0A803VB31_FICAL